MDENQRLRENTNAMMDTPAGRLLKNLYGANTGRKAGLAHTQKNREEHIKKLQAGWEPKPVAPPPKPDRQPVIKTAVAVPKVGRAGGAGVASTSAGVAASLDDIPASTGTAYRPARRPYEEIKEELDRILDEQMNETRNMRPKGPLLDEKEKARLAMMNEWGGRPPPEVVAALNGGGAASGRPVVAAAPPRQKPTERQYLEGMFSRVMDEIEERKDFLSEMERQGTSGKYSNYIQREIQERIAELKKIDGLLKSAA